MKLKLLLVLLSGLLLGMPLFASHDIGNSLSYECLGGNTYKIISTDYVECNNLFFAQNLPMGSGPFPGPSTTDIDLAFDTLGCSGSITPLGSWTTTSWSEISLLCPNVLTSCMDPQGAPIYGVAELTYERNYQIIKGSCSDVTISYTTCCRISSLNNTNSFGLYNEIVLELGSGACDNSSPKFKNHPPYYVCSGDTITYDMSAYDLDGDSLVYYMEVPYTNPGTPITYVNGYSLTSPMGGLWYVNLESQTGLITIASSSGSPIVATMAIVVEEFRNGVSLGKTRTDFSVVGTDCSGNVAPKPSAIQVQSGGIATGNYSMQVFAGVQNNFSITFTDSLNDSLRLVNNFFSSFPTGTVSVTGTNPLEIAVTWTPDSSLVGTTLSVGPSVADNGCPFPMSFYQPISIEVIPFSIDATITDSDCQLKTGAIDLTLGTQGGPFTFQWSNGATTEDLTGIGPGTYTVTITGNSGLTIFQSYLVEAGSIQANATLIKPSCGQNNGAIFTLPTGGTAPYTYQWSTGATSSTIAGLAEGGYSVVIEDANGCYEVESVLLEEPDSCSILISGTVYFDSDQNCFQDSTEVGTPNILVYASTGYGVLTDSLGNYTLEIEPGSGTLTAYPPNDPSICSSAPYSFNYSATGIDTTGVDFPWYNHPVQDLRVFIGGSTIRSGFPNRVSPRVYNWGDITMNGTVEFTYDSALCLQSISPAPLSVDSANRTITWDFMNLLPSTWEQFDVWFKPDSTLVIGDFLEFSAVVYPIVGDDDSTDNRRTRIRQIRGPFDPNNKEVSPRGIREPGYILASENIRTYTVNFQNIGNYPAKNVLIRDTLDTDLDISSIQPETSSHPYALSIRPGRILEFYFEDINLPDSISDPIGSNGYVSFNVSHDPNLPTGTVFTNKAGIYFDFNAPIITNEVSNTIYAQPEIALPNDSRRYCEGDELVANVVAEGMEPYTYTWNSGTVENNISQLTSTDSITTSGWYVVEVEDAFGFTAIDSVEIDVRPLPTLSVTWERDISNVITFDPGATEADSYLWTFSNGFVSSNPNPSFDFSGVDSLEVNLVATNSCGTTEYTELIVLVSNLDVPLIGGVKIYPQPASNFVRISWEHAVANATIQIYSFDGKMVREAKADRLQDVQISTDNLTSGLYMYQIKVDGSMVHGGKLLIE
ncbi:MAG: T9SS type A sorting domain-containing protein [Bacteroidota bacterium]